MIAHEWREPSGRKKFPTVAARLHWSYANLAMAHAALKNGAEKYGPFPYFQIRARLYAGLTNGTMAVRGLFDDERLRVLSPACCAYCGAGHPTTVDHLLPRARGGDDQGENLVPACSSCNSAKGKKDVMAWHRERSLFPSLSVTRRYLKLALKRAAEANAMSLGTEGTAVSLPFEIMAVPMVYPSPAVLAWEIGGP